MKYYYLLPILSFFFLTELKAQTSCATIESILVDACGTPEGHNEMFRFKVGAANLNTADLTVTWSSNPWLGVCQDATTAADVAALNRTILTCGYIEEPVGGVLPAGAEVLFITSENMDTLANSFANLQDTIIVLFQCGSPANGQFKNYTPGVGGRTTILNFSGANGCHDTATYIVDSLVDQSGNHTAQNGAAVSFNNSTLATSYYNTGCIAPIPTTTVQVLTGDTTVCQGNAVLLKAAASNYKSLQWGGGNGSFSTVDSLTTVYTPAPNDLYPVTLTLNAYKKCSVIPVSANITISKFPNGTSAGSNVSICSGKNIVLNATGGTSYTWRANPYLSCTNCGSPVATPPDTSYFFVSITDNHNCANLDSVMVAVNANDSVSVKANDTICPGGSIIINAYSNNGYLWTPATNLSCTNCSSPKATPTATAVYTVSSLGTCSLQKQVQIVVLLPDTVNINVSSPLITCLNDSVILTAKSKTNGLSYNWGAGITTSDKAVNSPGLYTVTATDPVFGCTATASTTINENITVPDVSIAPPAKLTCAITSAVLTASSTNNGVTFNWGGVTTASDTVSSPGGYSVVATDPSNGCTASASVTLGQSISPPDITIAPPAKLTCAVTSVVLTASSITNGVTFNWGGVTTASDTVSSPGGYSVIATDPSNGCTASTSVTVSQSISTPNITIAPPAKLTCAVTSVVLIASSTTNGVTFNWGGVTTATDTVSSPGGYSVTATDPSNGCTASTSVTVSQSISPPNITIAPPGKLTCTVTSVVLIASSTTNGITFNWGGVTTANDTVSSPGGYSVTASDPSNGCTANATVTVSQSETPLAITIAPYGNLTCTNTSVTLKASSSTSGLTYKWGQVNADTLTVSSPGEYYVTGTDPSNGCTSIDSVSVNQSVTPPDVQILGPDTLTCTVTTIALTASSNTNGVTYNWGNVTTATNSVSAAGKYSVTATDPSNGCTAQDSVNVNQSVTIPDINITPPANLTCAVNNVSLIAYSATKGVIYNWGGVKSDTDNISSPGIYSVTVTDPGNGCTASSSVTVNKVMGLNSLIVHASPSTQINSGDSTILGFTVPPGTNPYTIVWSPPYALSCLNCEAPVASPKVTTTYTIQINDSAGCSGTDTVTVFVILNDNIFIPNAFTPNGDGNNDYFQLYGNLQSIKYIDLQVFNRWGEVVFESKDPQYKWDGKYRGSLQDAGVYIWVLNISYLDGYVEQPRQGSLMLLR